MAIVAPNIGIDLGTENTSVYVRGRGIVISEPTIVVVDREDKHRVLAVGDEARFMQGRSPESILPVYPIKNGMISDFDMTEILIRYFIRKAIGVSHLIRPRVIVSIPCGLADVNRKALTEAVRMAGGKQVLLVEKPFASALGTGLDVYKPVGSMVVDIGAGTTDIAVISLGGLVVSQSVQIGGNRFDEAIIQFLRKEKGILIGRQTAESIKKDLAAAMKLEEPRRVSVRGFSQNASSAESTFFTSDQAHDAICEPCLGILSAIKWVLERTPPELASDILKTGIHLTGGGARLFALDKFISSQLGLPVKMAKEPGDCTISGIGYLADNIDLVLPKTKRS